MSYTHFFVFVNSNALSIMPAPFVFICEHYICHRWIGDSCGQSFMQTHFSHLSVWLHVCLCGMVCFLELFQLNNPFPCIHSLQQAETPSDMQEIGSHTERSSSLDHQSTPRLCPFVTEVDRSAASRSSPICTWRAVGQSPVPSVACQNPTGPTALRKCKYPLMVSMQMDASMTIAPVLAVFVRGQYRRAITMTQQNYACSEAPFLC